MLRFCVHDAELDTLAVDCSKVWIFFNDSPRQYHLSSSYSYFDSNYHQFISDDPRLIHSIRAW